VGVRILYVLALGFAPLCAFAQDSAPASGQFHGPLASGVWPENMLRIRPALNPAKFVGPASGASPVCSIPLLKAQIPQEIHFAMKQVAPQSDALAIMPEAKPPAPSCETPRPVVTK